MIRVVEDPDAARSAFYRAESRREARQHRRNVWLLALALALIVVGAAAAATSSIWWAW